MAKRRRRRNRSRRRNYRHRRRNPVFAFQRPRRRRSHRRRSNRHHYRRHRNPSILGLSLGEVFTMTAAGVVNGIATRSIPQMVLGANNQGIVGYGANAGTAFIGALVAKWIGGQRAAIGAIVGGFAAVAQRIVSDLMGSKLGDLNLSGDLDFDLSFYIGNSFPVPTAGTGPYLLNAGYAGSPMASIAAGGVPVVPAALPAAAAAAGGGHHGMGDGDRWSSRWSN